MATHIFGGMMPFAVLHVVMVILTCQFPGTRAVAPILAVRGAI